MINSQVNFKQFFDEQKKFLSTILQESKNYNSFFITATYVGFFTIFNAIKSYLNQNELFRIVILITISIFSFVLWEIGKMIYNSIIILKYFNSIKKEPSKTIEIQQNLQKSIFDSNKILIPLWLIVLTISALT
ncbi:MAG: hypothetical protein PHC64_09085 [Candidatus Gastranaerophilales bacterium]|nr:hypothetical protein [Candidatus Gastranaerophilales bacterium]